MSNISYNRLVNNEIISVRANKLITKYLNKSDFDLVYPKNCFNDYNTILYIFLDLKFVEVIDGDEVKFSIFNYSDIENMSITKGKGSRIELSVRSHDTIGLDSINDSNQAWLGTYEETLEQIFKYIMTKR